MAWRERLHLDGKGSFRGIEFCVSSVASKIGRRVVVREFPGRSTAATEDNGRRARRFHLTCYLVDQEYDVDRDNLREAFEQEGQGELVHPYWGRFQAVVTSEVDIHETDREGGMARFDLDLVEVGDQVLTKAVADAADEVQVAADAAGDAAAAEFEAAFSVAGAIDAVRSKAASAIGALTTQLAAARNVVNASLNVIDSVGDLVTDLAETAAGLILAPGALVAGIRGAIAASIGAISTLDTALSQAIALGGRDTAPEDGSLFGDFRAARARDFILTLADNGGQLAPASDDASSQSRIEAANQRALVKVYRALGVIEGARAVASLDYESRDTVAELRDSITELIDAQAIDAGDELFSALADLRDSFTRRMDELAENLPELIEHTPQVTRPAICIAYDLHGDARRESELVARNAIPDPNFVMGLIPLQVIVDE